MYMTLIRYAHLADIHLGSFREKKLKQLHIQQFIKLIDTIIDEELDFVLVAGDIFNVAMPPLEYVELVIEQINRLKKESIQVFVIGGSHDYSLTHKSFIQVLHSARVWRDVGVWEVKDEQTISLIPTKITIKNVDIEICGVLGKKNGLDMKLYEKINPQQLSNTDSSLSNSSNTSYSIFMFHTTIQELLPSRLKQIQNSYSIKQLPKGFNYYAGGHIHVPNQITQEDSSIISYCGPLFPNSFSEMKEGFSGFNIVEFDSQTNMQTITYTPLPLISILQLSINCSSLLTNEIDEKIQKEIEQIQQQTNQSIQDSIILFELFGEVRESLSLLDISKYIDVLYSQGAYLVIKNTLKLSSQKTQVKKHNYQFSTIQELENKISSGFYTSASEENNKEEISSIDTDSKINYIEKLLQLDVKKLDDETNYHFEERIITSIKKILEE